jgi:sensor domain CHASE-containing protein
LTTFLLFCHFVAIIDDSGNHRWKKIERKKTEEDSKKQLQQKGVNEIKIFAK